MKEKIESVSQDSALEYAFEKVPYNKRRNLLNLTTVLSGYPVALSNFIIGGLVGAGLTFSKAIFALLVMIMQVVLWKIGVRWN